MKIVLLILSLLFLSPPHLFGQTGSYASPNEKDSITDWLLLLDYGSFEIICDKKFYSYSTGAGLYTENNNMIELNFFLPALSEVEISKVEENEDKNIVSIEVLSLLDSTIIENASLFAIDNKEQEYSSKVNQMGKVDFSVPKGNSIRYLRIQSDKYIACEVDIKEGQKTGYVITAYLRKDPLIDKYYTGPKSITATAVRKDKNIILYNDRIYKKTTD